MEIPNIFFSYKISLEEVILLSIIREYHVNDKEYTIKCYASTQQILKLKDFQLQDRLISLHKKGFIETIRLEKGFKFLPCQWVLNLEKEKLKERIQLSTREAFSPSKRFYILNRDHFTCCCCGASPANTFGIELAIDHIVPIAEGGNNDIYNLQTVCTQCNYGKSSSLIFEKE